MRTTILGLLAVVVMGLSAASADAVVGYRRGYNPYTGRMGTTTYARNPYTGTYGARRTVYNPYTGRAATNTVRYNPYTDTRTRTGTAVNPYTGRYADYGTVRRW